MANFLKKGIVIAALTGTLLAPVVHVQASQGFKLTTAFKELNSDTSVKALTNALAEVKKESSAAANIAIKTSEELQFELYFENISLANTEDHVLVYAEADENSAMAGKLYKLSNVTVEAVEEEWSLIKSGNLTGYVKNENLLSGRDAIEAAKALLTEVYVDTNIYTLTKEEVFENFSVGETEMEERIRLAEEEAARLAAERAAEAARKAAEKAEELRRGKNVIGYATQFVGNPYVYGGTSLTRGTDCSGFVKSVYAHFGVYLPRTSYSMRGVGDKVSYDQMQPGDIVCYSGHVALYMGDGQIVHAANSRDGIKISDVNYARILTIRRVL